MDKCTHEVRMQYWKNIISQCQSRPAGQTAKQWITENDICEQTYYLWQRRIRKETYEQMASQEFLPAVSEKEKITFAEISVPENKQHDCYHDTQEPVIHPVAVIKTSGYSKHYPVIFLKCSFHGFLRMCPMLVSVKSYAYEYEPLTHSLS